MLVIAQVARLQLADGDLSAINTPDQRQDLELGQAPARLAAVDQRPARAVPPRGDSSKTFLVAVYEFVLGARFPRLLRDR